MSGSAGRRNPPRSSSDFARQEPPVGRRRPRAGFTLVELMIAVAILGILAAMATVAYQGYLARSRTAKGIQDIQSIQLTITAFEGGNHALPANLQQVGMDGLLDPWGHAYHYQRLDLVPKGSWRKDKNLVPLNSTYDLWSAGADGLSQAPLTAKVSNDDIIRANDGSFVGLASDY